MEVWIAFGCGLIIGSCLGVGALGLVQLNRRNDLYDKLDEKDGRIEDLTTTRTLLKEEIFRLTKNYKPRKPQPRKRRNYKKKFVKK